MGFYHLLQIAELDDRLGCWVSYSGNQFVGWRVLAPSDNHADNLDTEANPITNSNRVETRMRIAPQGAERKDSTVRMTAQRLPTASQMGKWQQRPKTYSKKKV